MLLQQIIFLSYVCYHTSTFCMKVWKRRLAIWFRPLLECFNGTFLENGSASTSGKLEILGNKFIWKSSLPVIVSKLFLINSVPHQRKIRKDLQKLLLWNQKQCCTAGKATSKTFKYFKKTNYERNTFSCMRSTEPQTNALINRSAIVFSNFFTYQVNRTLQWHCVDIVYQAHKKRGGNTYCRSWTQRIFQYPQSSKAISTLLTL